MRQFYFTGWLFELCAGPLDLSYRRICDYFTLMPRTEENKIYAILPFRADIEQSEGVQFG
ncbi:MAG: hypothetical protein IPJ71_18860 [Bdellovibrionales bacterium]|nr:hypothetical protein [Bdellovibrionales bacterium]